MRATRVCARRAGYEPTPRSNPQMPTLCGPPRLPQRPGDIPSGPDMETGSSTARTRRQRSLLKERPTKSESCRWATVCTSLWVKAFCGAHRPREAPSAGNPCGKGAELAGRL